MIVDPTKPLPAIVCIDIADEHKPPPFWMLSLADSGQGDVTGLERECIAEEGVAAGFTLGDGQPADYATASDATKVAVAMMRKRPELIVRVSCSDGSQQSFVPLAHIITSVKVDLP